MKFKTAFIALAGAFLLYGCKSDNNQPVDPDSFRFIGRVYDYNGAKYEMTPGDSVGLYAAEPLSVLNRRGAYDASGYIVLNPSIYPVDGASGTTPVLAYKPLTPKPTSLKPSTTSTASASIMAVWARPSLRPRVSTSKADASYSFDSLQFRSFPAYIFPLS